MGLQRQVVDLIQAEARALADGAIDSTLRQLLTQRREGAGKHLWMKVDEQWVAGDAIRGRVRILTVCLLVVSVAVDGQSESMTVVTRRVWAVAFRLPVLVEPKVDPRPGPCLPTLCRFLRWFSNRAQM